MLVVYNNGNEVLVCTSGKNEKKMLKDYFTNGGRSLNDYDRTVIKTVVEILSQARVSGDGQVTNG